MKILISPNAFKGALSAELAAEAIEMGLKQASSSLDCVVLPIADGGDGSLGVIARYLKAEIFSKEVVGPLGERVVANYGWHDSGQTAIVELAEASGIKLVQSLDPWNATTFGTGQLIRGILARGAKKIYLTVGGSATVDGALGILDALGVTFFEGDELIDNPKPSDIKRISRMEVDALMQLTRECALSILCDVENPLLGDEGAAKIFGPQKGLSDKGVVWFDDALKWLADLVTVATGREVHSLPHGGAAGGVAAVLHGLLGAELLNGGEQILEWTGFLEHLGSADLLITGEGKIDQQTNYGKGPGLVARKANQAGVKVIGLTGGVQTEIVDAEFFDVVLPIIHSPEVKLQDAMNYTYTNLERTAYQLGKLLAD